MAIVSAVIVVAGLGALFGYLLSWAEKKLAVEKNEKEIQLESLMPGANCGGCGFAGCNAYADAVANGEAKIGLCVPGGAATAAKMAAVMKPSWWNDSALFTSKQKAFYTSFIALVCSVGVTLMIPTLQSIYGGGSVLPDSLFVATEGISAMKVFPI